MKIKKIKSLFFVSLIFCGTLFSQNNPVRSKPNIIFILADDLGYGDIGCYGQQRISTPNIDALAKNGMRFTQYYSGSAVCAPARATFMTGLHTGHAPVRGNVTIKPEGQFPLPEATVTFPMRLQQAGYNTAAFGKWSLGFVGGTGDPLKKGFDHFYGYNCQTMAHDYYPDHLWQDDQRINLGNNPYKHTVYSADDIHSKAIAFLQQQRKAKPFFAYLPYTLPHADLTVPHNKVYEQYVKKFNEKPLVISHKRDTADGKPFEPYPHAAFAAMVSRLDKYVGEIVSLVNQKKLDKNTIIIFTSDNGPHKEDGGDPQFFNSNGGLRGIKRDLYEGGIREPFIIQWKGTIQPGLISNSPIAMWDIYPTVMDLLASPGNRMDRMEVPGDGISLLPLFYGNELKRNEPLYWELHEGGGKQAVRQGKWKGIKLNVSTAQPTAMELYDLDADPSEKKNVALQFPLIVQQLELIIQNSHYPDKSWPLFPYEK